MKRILIAVAIAFFCILSWTATYAAQRELRLLYMNDFHGYANSHKPYGSDENLGGIAYLAWLAGELRKDKPTLFLAAGDMIQGNIWANLFQGKSVIDVMNRMNIDAMVLGNHEFDFGQGTLKERVREATFPFLSANIGGLDFIKPYVIKELDGIKIAVIGITTEDTPIMTHPKNVEGVKFLSPVETAKKYVDELRNSVDLVILLTHIGYYNDMVLAEKVKGIDIIVGGHSHTKIERPALVGKTVIVQAWEHAEVLGVMDIRLEDGKMTGVSNKFTDIKPAQLKKDAAVDSIVNTYGKKIDALLHEVIGETETELDGTNTRKRETNFGNLVADVVRQTSGAQAAIINGGSIRTSIKKGEIQMSDIYTALPFDSYITAFTLSGRKVQEALEYALSSLRDGDGRFPQVSGMTFTYTRSQDKSVKINRISIAGIPLEPDKPYTVGTTDFLAAGGDGYKVFKDAIRSSDDYSTTGGALKGETIVYSDPGTWLKDVMIGHIKNQKKIAPKTEGRIIEDSP